MSARAYGEQTAGSEQDHHTGADPRLGRRRLLVSSAAALGAAVLAGCGSDTDTPEVSTGAKSGSDDVGNTPAATTSPRATGADKAAGSATSPLPAPATLTEAPELTAQVKAGKLPKLSKRIPANPYVVPHHWVERGNYGGQLKMNIPKTGDGSIAQFFYGFSPLRLLNDGVTIGPGLAYKWGSNADTSVWTFHFRKGLRWSDGHPWTTADIMFWWKYMANYDGYTAEGVPDECKSAKGSVATITAPDPHTLEIRFDAPAPLTAAKVASYVSGCRGNGTSWMAPAHFVKQYHPEFNANVPKSWSAPGGQWETHCDYKVNPKCPTMTGFQLEQFKEGRSQTWKRNPYYYAVTRDGDQLPYLDGMVMTVVQDPQVGKLQIGQGKVDFAHGPFTALQLADVSTLMADRAKSGIDVFFWDSGSGTGSVMFCNYDYKDPDYRQLFRKPKFRQALSLAFNRAQARKAIYFNQGQPTTGTLGTKGAEFVDSAKGRKVYQQWRDAYVDFDPDRAKKMLDQLGVVDKDGDGFRELPNGKKLQLRIDLQADAVDEHKQKDNQLVRDWKAIGVNARVNPVPPTSFDDFWADGTYMIHSDWEVSGPANTLLGNPYWIIPMTTTTWAPLEGQMYALRGTKAEHEQLDVDPYKRKPPRMAPVKGGPVEQLWTLLDEARVEPDSLTRNNLFFQMCKIQIEQGPFFQGTVANYPAVEVVKNGLKNVPRRDDLYVHGNVNTWSNPTPTVHDPEIFFWDDPSAHHV